MGLISKEKALEIIAAIGGCDATSDYDRGFDEAARDIYEAVSRMEEADGWIPVSERLPEMEKYYLVTIKKWGGEYDTEYCFFEDGKWYLVADGSNEENTSWREEIKSVVAWRPLPELYREVANDSGRG